MGSFICNCVLCVWGLDLLSFCYGFFVQPRKAEFCSVYSFVVLAIIVFIDKRNLLLSLLFILYYIFKYIDLYYAFTFFFRMA